MLHKTKSGFGTNPDKIICYFPPELGTQVKVSFYLSPPDYLDSQLLPKKNRGLLIVDANLDSTKLQLVLSLIKKQLPDITVYHLKYGLKNLDQVKKIWHQMVIVHPDVAIALGGGTTCDLVGFAAACYHRGLDHIFFPTTLLSMVDACIGGKTGIDFDGVKNSVGQVHYARESYCIFPFLETLPYDELISGFSEVIKAAMLFDKKLFKRIQKLPSKFRICDEWFETVSRGAELKALMCQQPLSQRSKLLYGHNIGHGYETFGKAHKRHGDCVSIGMNYELAIGVSLNLVKKSVWEEQYQVLSKLNLPTKIPKAVGFEKIKQKMQKYKLYKSNEYLFVIPKGPGLIIEDGNNYFVKVSESKLDAAYEQARVMIVR